MPRWIAFTGFILSAILYYWIRIKYHSRFRNPYVLQLIALVIASTSFILIVTIIKYTIGPYVGW